VWDLGPCVGEPICQGDLSKRQGRLSIPFHFYIIIIKLKSYSVCIS
jgi:hypothetical protein